jgi:hypothetical protein
MAGCDICKTKYLKAVKRKKIRSKYNPVNVYRQKVNVQKVRVNGKVLKLCRSCRRKVLKIKG